MKHITNREMGVYVTRREEFNNSKGLCYARREMITRGDYRNGRYENPEVEWLYVVYSYGAHFPLLVFSEATQTWYGNKTPNSRTTNRHRKLACPCGVEITWLSNDDMIDLASWGVIGLIQEKFRNASGTRR